MDRHRTNGLYRNYHKRKTQKVIEGEQGGISKAINWQGGGNFVYAELMPLNAIYKEKYKFK